MITVEDARRIVQEVHSRREQEHRKGREDHAKEINGLISFTVKELCPRVFQAIERAPQNGQSSCRIECCEHSMDYSRSATDCVRVHAYRKIMKELARAPYEFRVRESKRKGYDGEGNNMHDFYTMHSREISW